jgi:hypothetical protein
MGSCAGIKRKPSPIPQLLFFSRKNKKISIKTDKKTTKNINLTFSEPLSKSSALTIQDFFVFIVGGFCRLQESLSNEVIRLDLSTLTAEYLCSLPFSSKSGEVHVYKNYLYYIGGVRSHNSQSYPTPFMRLDLNKNLWEILNEKPREGKKLSISCHLFNPGSCKSNSSLFIMSGEVHVPNYQKSFNNEIYRIELESLEVTKIFIKSPSCLAPKCFFFNNSFIILGSNQERGDFSCCVDENGERDLKSLPFEFKSSLFFVVEQESMMITRKNMNALLDFKSFKWKMKNSIVDDDLVSESISAFLNLKSNALPALKCSLVSKYYEAELK